jgi:hypothetical protein
VNDAVLNGMLVSEHVDTDSDTEQRAEHLRGSQDIADLGAVSNEQVRLVVCELHDVHTSDYLWA